MRQNFIAALSGVIMVGLIAGPAVAADASDCLAEVKMVRDGGFTLQGRDSIEKVFDMLGRAEQAANDGKKKKCETLLKKAKDRIAEG